MNQYSEAHKKLGHFLESARNKMMLNPAEAARHLHIKSEQQLLEIEAGRQPVELIELYTFANVYNIPPEEFLQFLLDTHILASDEQVQIKAHLKIAQKR